MSILLGCDIVLNAHYVIDICISIAEFRGDIWNPETFVVRNEWEVLCDRFHIELKCKCVLYFAKVQCKAWVKAKKRLYCVC